jgi:ribosomal protein S18 acetylase RimI-like enzyme
VRGDNAGAIRLYEQRGYRTIGRLENYYQDGMTAVRYARELSDRSNAPAPPLGRAA